MLGICKKDLFSFFLKKETDLEQNLLASLESVLLESIKKSGHSINGCSYSHVLYRFASCTCRFKETYETGIDWKLAMWAQKTYKGHCMPPAKDILADYNKNSQT